MAKYMQDSTDIQINGVSGTDNINFSFKSGNSIDTKIGNLTDLKTTNKDSIVSAINEVSKPQMVLLYEGEWNSGNITLNDDITNYSIVYILMSGQGTYISCPIVPKELALNTTTGYVRGADGYASTANCYTFHFNASYQYATPNILTFVACKQVQHLASGNHSVYTDMPVKKIIGIK